MTTTRCRGDLHHLGFVVRRQGTTTPALGLGKEPAGCWVVGRGSSARQPPNSLSAQPPSHDPAGPSPALHGVMPA